MTRFKKGIALFTLIATLLSAFLCVPVRQVSAAGTETPFYDWKQYDPQWKDVYIGSNTIGNIGCYVTSSAILICYGGLRNESNFDPATLVSELKEVGGFSGNLIYKGKINKAVPGFTYKGEVLLGKTQSEKTETIEYYLNKGYYIIAGTKNLGHYVAIREVKNGVVYMMDPASESTVLFDYYASSGVTKIFLYTSTGKKVNIGDNANDNDSSTDTSSGYKAGIYETTDDLNLRASATTSSSSLAVIPEGAELTITEFDGIWGKTVYQNKSGFVCMEYVKLISEIKDPAELSSEDPSSEEPSSEEPSSEEPSSEEPSSEEPSSEEPSSEDPSSEEPSSEEPSSEEPSSEEPSSEEPSSEDTSSEDSSTSGDGSEEPSKYVPGRYILTGNVYLRKGPASSYASITVIPKGTEIEVTEIVNNWARTVYNGNEGFCGLAYARLLEEFVEDKEEVSVSVTTDGEDGWITVPDEDEYLKGYYDVLENLNLRESPSTSGSKIVIMPAGSKVKAIEIKNGWAKVEYNQYTGWCSLEYCEFDSPYLENVTIYAPNLIGTLSKEADLSNVSLLFYYSDGSVYSVKKGISVSYVIPTSASVVTATAEYDGKDYSFQILYTSSEKINVQNEKTYVIVSHKDNAEDVFGNKNVNLASFAENEIDGLKFTVIMSGDVDGDGKISATDYLLVKQTFISGSGANEEFSLAADCDFDGKLSSTDYLYVKSALTK